MNNMREWLTQVNVKDLIKIFNIQISIAVVLVFVIFRSLFSQIILKILFKITKNTQKVKETRIYKILNNFFIFVGLYLAIRVLRPTAQVLAVVNSIFKIICIIFVTNVINSFITKDSKWFKKYIKHSRNDTVNGFICKLARGIVWIISIYVMLKELGYDLTGLVAGFGIRKCYYFISCSRHCKKSAKWYCYFD